jgi:hypothetical chaperone protein
VAAAYGYQQRLDHEELVLIGDFGGGTSDFTLMRLGPDASTMLGVDGVARAGDAFDARLIRHVAAPGLVLGSERRTAFGQVLPVPLWPYERVERWEQLSFLKSRETSELLRTLRHEALAPEKIAALVRLVEDDLGFALHEAVDGLLAASGVAPRDVPVVFLTGGSSFVPAVRQVFAERFGAARLRGGDEHTTVASGLALRARALAGMR